MIPRLSLGPILALCACASAAAFALDADARAIEPGPARAVAAEDSDFIKAFTRAHKQNSSAEMQKLVKSRQAEAVVAAVDLAQRLVTDPSAELEPLLTSLDEAWKAQFKSEFVAKLTAYFKSVDEAKQRDRVELLATYEKALGEFEGNLEKKDGQTFDFVYAKLRDYPDYFDQAGDSYFASQSAYIVARCLDEALRGDGADLHGAWQAYVKAITHREKFDLKDGVYEECVRRRNALAAKGADKKKEPAAPQDGGGGGSSGGAPASAPAASAPAVKVALTFELVPAAETYQRPNFLADDITEMWTGVTLDKANGGNKGTFKPMGAVGPVVQRFGAADVRIDGDGDGTPEEKVPMTGNIMPVKIMLGSGTDARPWAFLCFPGSDKANYQGIEVNLAPSNDRMTLYALGAASVVGTLDGVPVRMIDETLDGSYGSRPQNIGYDGLSKGVYQPEFDSMVIGASKHAVPWSETAEINGKWYRLTMDPAGRELTAQPIVPRTGFLKLDFKGAGVTPSVLIVQGKAGELEKAFFDIADGGAKGVAVPVGEYGLLVGQLRKGKKKQVQKCLILPGGSTPTWKVREGETTVVELGGPFSFDFKATTETDKITVEGQSVRVIGKSNERYERTWNCVPRPEIAWRKKGTKKPSKYERMPVAAGNEIINQKGWGAPWSPLDLVIEAKGAGEGVELQLVDKKHDLFGKVESEWKE